MVICPLIALTVAITGRPLTYDKDPREETAVSPSNSRPFPSVNVAEAGELELSPDSFCFHLLQGPIQCGADI